MILLGLVEFEFLPWHYVIRLFLLHLYGWEAVDLSGCRTVEDHRDSTGGEGLFDGGLRRVHGDIGDHKLLKSSFVLNNFVVINVVKSLAGVLFSIFKFIF